MRSVPFPGSCITGRSGFVLFIIKISTFIADTAYLFLAKDMNVFVCLPERSASIFYAVQFFCPVSPEKARFFDLILFSHDP